MNKLSYAFLLLFLPFIFFGCSKKNEDNSSSQNRTMEVQFNDIPFKTNKFLRIPYTLKTWEWKKQGLSLRQIDVVDNDSKTILATYNTGQFPRIYMDPLPPSTVMTFDKIYNYYFSIQLTIPVEQTPPVKIFNRLVFRDTVNNTDVTVEGGEITPRYSESPIVIASPVKGTHWMFFNQSTNEYHFNALFFSQGKIGTGERFAFDNGRLDDDFNLMYAGDPTKNSSYFCFRDTLYAVANGVILACRDTMVENDGNTHDHLEFLAPIDYAGNYMILEMDNGYYALYAHCSRYSMMIHAGDTVKEGQPLALLGNSGNSDAPHLHFEIVDAPDFFFGNGQPFVLKKFTKIGEYQNTTPMTPEDYYDRMMEERTALSFE